MNYEIDVASEAIEAWNKAVRQAVIHECQGRNDGGAPHATAWMRGGSRNDAPTLCDRCERLIRTIQELAAREAKSP